MRQIHEEKALEWLIPLVAQRGGLSELLCEWVVAPCKFSCGAQSGAALAQVWPRRFLLDLRSLELL